MKLRLRRLAFAVLLTLLAADVSVTLFATEAGLFLGQPLPPFGAITHPRQRTWAERARAELERDALPTDLGIFDPELGWTTRPNYRSADGQITSNSRGARGQREYATPRPSDVVRVATFGDSFTYGDQVVDSATWQAVLERTDATLEVPNFGVGGYGTDQALLRFRRMRASLDAQVVVVGILLENIGRNVNRYRPLWYPKAGGAVTKPRFLLGDSELTLVPQPVATRAELIERVLDGSIVERVEQHEYWLDRPTLGPLQFSSLARISGALLARRERSPERLWRDAGGEPRRTTLAILRTFVREALEGGAERALVVVFPRESDLASAAGERYWGPGLAELAAGGVEVLDVATALLAARAENSTEPLYQGGHLSPRGNAIVAREVAAWLANRPAGD